jgi:hypothetical protein
VKHLLLLFVLAVLSVQQADAAWSYIGSRTGTSNSGVVVLSSIDTTQATLVVVMVSVGGWNVPYTISVTDSAGGNTWALPADIYYGGLTLNTNMYYSFLTNKSASHVFTCNGTYQPYVCQAMVFSGAGIKQTSGGTYSSSVNGNTTISISAPTLDGSLIVTGFANKSGTPSGASIDAGFSTPSFVTGVGGSGAMSYLIQGSKAAVSPAWTITGISGIVSNFLTATFSPTGSAAVPRRRVIRTGQ